MIIHGDALTKLKGLPNQSVNMCMTSPPYWALRDYGTDVETIWDEKEDCEHIWEIGKTAGDTRIEKRSKSRAGWERPSREEFANRRVDSLCPVCKNEFEGKPTQTFCSIKCSNTLSNEQRTSTKQTSNICQRCGAWKGQLGLEPTFELYIKHLCDIFDEVKRVLRDDGTCWVNIGDTYSSGNRGANIDAGFNLHNADLPPNRMDCGIPDKSLVMIPFRFAIEMVNRGWILRNTIIWYKPSCMPSSVKDRFTVDFEYLFFFSKKKNYYFETQYEPHKRGTPQSETDYKRMMSGRQEFEGQRSRCDYCDDMRVDPEDPDGEKECPYCKGIPNQNSFVAGNKEGRNKRTVWTINPKPFKEAHFAVYPEELCETPIKAGCPEFVCKKCGKPREAIFEPSEEYKKLLRNQGKGWSSERRKEAIKIGNALTEGTRHDITADYRMTGYTDCGCNVGFMGGIVLDPFFGAGTTGLVALKQNKKFIGIELNKEYIEIAKKRLKPYLEQEKL